MRPHENQPKQIYLGVEDNSDILNVKMNDEILKQTRVLYEAMYRFDAQAAQALGLHVTDLRCINALEKGPLSAGEIASRLALTSGSVTALINRLSAKGYVVRLTAQEDARKIMISLTPLFRARAHRVFEALGVAIGGQFATLGAQERQAGAEVLARLAAGFEAGAAATAQGEDAVGEKR
jgi:DNA-binding MarR family transcriptional regulator